MSPARQLLETEAETLRRALARNDFAAAEASARRYTALVRSATATLPRGAAIPLLDQACRFMEWARRQVCASRARIAQRLTQVEGASRYFVAPAASTHTWKLQA